MAIPKLLQCCLPDDCDNPCCAGMVTIGYYWDGTSSRDLDTNTTFLGYQGGWACGDGGGYVIWNGDNTSENASETCNVDVGKAKSDGLWTSSVNIDLHAGWFKPAEGSGSIYIVVSYKGDDIRRDGVSVGKQSSCASTSVGTVTIYSSKQSDGKYFTFN